jgi:hypothetical protein
VIVAAVVRAIGDVRHTSLRSDLESLASITDDPAVAAEIAVAAKRLSPDLSLDVILSWFQSELATTGVLLELLKHPDSVVFNRNNVESRAQKSLSNRIASAAERVELAMLINAPVDASETLPTDSPRELALALASGQQSIDQKTNAEGFAVLAADFPRSLTSLDSAAVSAISMDDRKLQALAPILTPAQKQHLVDTWVGTPSADQCTKYEIHANVNIGTAQPRDLACLDAAQGDARELLAFVDRHDDTYASDPSVRHELLRASYGMSQIVGRAIVVRLIRNLDASGAARLAAQIAAQDSSFIQHDFFQYWPLLSDTDKLEALAGMITPPFLDRLEKITADPNESMGIRLRAMHHYCALSGYAPSEVMLDLLRS